MFLALLFAASTGTVLSCQIKPASIGEAVDGFTRSELGDDGMAGHESASLVIRATKVRKSGQLTNINVSYTGKDYLGLESGGIIWSGRLSTAGGMALYTASIGEYPRRSIWLVPTAPNSFSAEWVYEYNLGGAAIDGWSGVGTCEMMRRIR